MVSRLDKLHARIMSVWIRCRRDGKYNKAEMILLRWEDWWSRDCQRRAQMELQLVAEIDTDA